MTHVINNCPGARVDKAKTRRIARGALNLLGRGRESVSICFVTDSKMSRLNKQYRNKKGSTPVLSFSLKEGAHIKGEGTSLGDVVISYPMAKRCAQVNGLSLDKQIRFYIIHGILNLC